MLKPDSGGGQAAAASLLVLAPLPCLQNLAVLRQHAQRASSCLLLLLLLQFVDLDAMTVGTACSELPTPATPEMLAAAAAAARLGTHRQHHRRWAQLKACCSQQDLA
jgi:hypothetical protein